jgi:hypothetical protein
MFHPVGSQPPSVYWRRRLVVLGTVVVLLVLIAMTLKVISSGTDDPAGAQGTPQSSAAKTSGAKSLPHSSPAKRTSSSRSTARSSRSSSTAAAPPSCASKQLAVSAVTGKSGYQVGDHPVLQLQVMNTGKVPCVQDLADKQVELKVYNGESRVWGSHDCKVQPGTAPRTLGPNTPVRVAITWSGLSSRPGCAGTRQRVGAGTYTLYAALSGKTGRATQFTMS